MEQTCVGHAGLETKVLHSPFFDPFQTRFNLLGQIYYTSSMGESIRIFNNVTISNK